MNSLSQVNKETTFALKEKLTYDFLSMQLKAMFGKHYVRRELWD
ncbi:MAG: hypothetical protein AAGE84_04155 [Cyanobacteria bacterium P01_G01_bin.39]